jgi:hypothetical protein
MLKQHVHRQVFLVPQLRSEAHLSPRGVRQILCVSAARRPVAHPVTDPSLKVIVFDGLVPNIRRGNKMHEDVVTDLDEVVESYYRLWCLLGSGQ